MESWLEQMVGRMDGPMYFRFILQPTMATLMAVKAGLADAREGHTPFGWAVVTDASARPQLLRAGFKDVSKIFVLAIILDLVYGFTVLKSIRPLQTLIVATLLALVPYALMRGPITRLARLKKSKSE
jgi:hypothetical protein